MFKYLRFYLLFYLILFSVSCKNNDNEETSNNNLPDTEVICNDGKDNDGDGAIDCNDYDCAYNPLCLHEVTCDDGVDNDNDFLTDCDDDDCMDAAYCNNPNTGNFLDVQVTTSSYGGYFAPRNCTAIWIQTPEGDFIKTIHLKCLHWRRFLTQWASVSGQDDDGISEATRNAHGTIYGRWDLTDQDGNTVPPGTYEFWVEYTEDNGTGVHTHGAIEIDGTEKTTDGTDTDYFSDFSASYSSVN